jgi:hypothetical protein
MDELDHDAALADGERHALNPRPVSALTPKAETNEKPRAGTTESLSLTVIVPVAWKTVPASPTDHL